MLSTAVGYKNVILQSSTAFAVNTLVDWEGYFACVLAGVPTIHNVHHFHADRHPWELPQVLGSARAIQSAEYFPMYVTYAQPFTNLGECMPDPQAKLHYVSVYLVTCTFYHYVSVYPVTCMFYHYVGVYLVTCTFYQSCTNGFSLESLAAGQAQGS